MKIRYTLTVEVDEDAWANEYGLTPGYETRQDAREHLTELIQGAVMEIPHVKTGLVALTRFE